MKFIPVFRNTLCVGFFFLLFFPVFLNAQSLTVLSFSPTGSTHTFAIPPCASNLTMVLRGAGGYNAGWGAGGGTGATVVITPTPGQLLYINVGSSASGTLGGFNGGGNGGVGSSTSGGGGGGASDIRVGNNSLSSRIVVAAGGGGSGGNGPTGANGGEAGGGIFPTCTAPYGVSGFSGMGSNFTSVPSGCAGGTITAYGAGGGGGGLTSGGGITGSLPGGFGGAGSLGQGGNGGDVNASSGGSAGGVHGGGGGGGGYYGGAGGMSGAFGPGINTAVNGGGGAGSTFINTVVCTFFDIGGMWPATGSVSITYSTQGTAVMASASASSLCAGSSASLTASGALSYTWFPVGSFGGANSQNITVAPATTTNYSLLATNAQGCVSQSVITISVAGNPTVNLVTTSTLICLGESAQLSATGANSYIWSTAQTTSSITTSPQTSTIYSVSGTNLSGCTAAASLQINVQTCTGIENTLLSDELIPVYPNPNTGEFTVTAPSAKTITIYDTTGKTVRIIQLEHPHEKLFVKGLAPGLYFVHFQNKSSVIVQKVLIQK